MDKKCIPINIEDMRSIEKQLLHIQNKMKLVIDMVNKYIPEERYVKTADWEKIKETPLFENE